MKRVIILALLSLIVSACDGGSSDGTGSTGTADPNALRSEIPEGFPVPLPEGGDVQTAARQESGDDYSYGALIEYEEDRYDELVELYDDWAGSLDQELERSEISGDRPGVSWRSLDTGLLITVSQAVSTATLAINVPPGAL